MLFLMGSGGTTSVYEPITNAITSAVTPAEVAAIIAIIVGSGMGFFLLYLGARKLIDGIQSAARSGKIKIG